MKCPNCGHLETSVLDTRANEATRFSDDAYVRRRRKCKKCGSRFTTVETVAGLTKRSTSVLITQQSRLRKQVVGEIRKRLKSFLMEAQ